MSVAVAAPLKSQAPATTLLDYSTGSEFEDYLRAMQLTGLTPLYPWSIRGFSQREIRNMTAADTAGPWRVGSSLNRGHAAVGPVTVRAIFNSAYPYGSNDGPAWAGRGLTASVSGGVAAILGPLFLTVAPEAFWAANRPFPLLDKKTSAAQPYANGIVPYGVDLPQRFGDKPYSRLSPGASTLRFDSKAITLGVSTANEWIGPATEYPFLLGNNAPGFPHIFVGTGEPLNLWIARLHTRFAWGKLDQSAYSPVIGSTHYTSSTMPGTVRLATYGTLLILPRGIPGLEVGAARFIHVPFRVGEPAADFWKKPFKIFFLKNEYASGDTAGADNQLASAFFRWVFPKGGFEVYGERGYEDQFYDTRDLVERPDHEREYMLGVQKLVNRGPASFDVIKGELINYQYPAGSIYDHGKLRQGHTNRGQLLGAAVGVESGAAAMLSWTRYTAGDRTTATMRRIVRADEGDYLNSGVVNRRSSDVIIAAGLERMRFGRRMDLGAKIEAMQDFNRNFSSDVPNLNVVLTARLRLQ